MKIKYSILSLVIFLIFTVTSMPAFANHQEASITQIKNYIVKCAVEMGVEPEIVLAIAKKESGFCQNKRSYMGAVGVFQLMPSTAKRMGYNPYNYRDNIKCGIAYYKKMKKMFNSDTLALAAYNAGPGNVKKYGGVPPFGETRRFVATCMSDYSKYKNNPDSTVSDILTTHKENKSKLAEQEKREVLTLYLLNQAI